MTMTIYPRIFVNGASGQLGHLVIDALLRRVPATAIVAGARSLDSEKVRNLRARGIEVREADYTKPGTLRAAFAGIDRLLLISSSEEGQRVGEHQNVINAAADGEVGLLVYTSMLHAAISPLPLAEDHRRTEAALKASKLPFVLLRNGWYTENYAASIGPALKYGVFMGGAGEGRISSAARADYADAAAVVLTTDNQAGAVYELAGDESYSLAEFSTAVAAESGKNVVYQDLPEQDFKAALLKSGMPDEMADLLASSDSGAAKGGLEDNGHQLSALIGRPTTPYVAVIRAALSTLRR